MTIPSQFVFFLISFVLHTLASPPFQYCRRDQRDALLEFKHEFQVNASNTSLNDDDDVSLSSWNKSSDDCCSWKGVVCDAKSTEVISLYLVSIPLKSYLKPNSGLFKLQNLQNLTLSNCHLYGNIPSSLGNLSHLTLVDLTFNGLVGQVPSSIGNLSRLTVLDLAHNDLVGQIPASIGKLFRLRTLDFGSNHLVGQVPSSIGNLSQLIYLTLSHNKLSGKVPNSFANLTNLSILDLYVNYFESLPSDMSGFHNLNFVSVGENSFVGPFPTFLFTILSLEWVNLGRNQFKGPLELGNISQSSRLTNLFIDHNQLDGTIPHSIFKLLNLEQISLSYNKFTGPFPTSFFMIPSMSLIELSGNQFSGPLEFGNTSSLSRITYLFLDDNKFDGPIPQSISEFLGLQRLDLSYNNFVGTIPRSISKLANLDYIHLSNNNFEGQIPGCLLRVMTATFSHNSFTSLGESSQVFDETHIIELDLSSNLFQGPFPHRICKLRSLRVLDLSNNSLNGSIPQCLRNSTGELEELILDNNNFNGVLPDIFFNATKLKALDVSHNQLEGKLPRSLINCKAMELVNVQSNKIKDKFPSWLGVLPLLSVVLLRTNQFYGPLYPMGFQSLRVIDVSHNHLAGTLSPFCFSGWREMTTLTRTDDTYMEIYLYAGGNYSNSMKLMHKGVDTEFNRIRKDFRAIDFSGNKFAGSIPESIGLLKELRLLNLSGNEFTSNIPQSLANLKNLETLDLSRNQLSGQIPQDLASLSFLSTMVFSHNNLQGPIPRSTQFQSQNCSSFTDNPKLYGFEETCEKLDVPNLTPEQSEELSDSEEQVINWISAAIAYGPGVFCGFVIGHIFVSRKHKWFMKKLRR